MKPYTLIFTVIFLTACSHSHLANNAKNSDSVKLADQNPNHLKTVREYNEIFLDGGINKVYDLLGAPDAKGDSPNGINGYYIYYDKVWDEGRTKHLLISYHDDRVTQIKTAIFGQIVASSAGNITIERPSGYESEKGSSNDEFNKIDKLYSSVDTTHITPFSNSGNGAGGYFYRTYHKGNLILLKQIGSLGGGDAQFTEYLFVNGRVRFKYVHYLQEGLTPEKVYVNYNGDVIKYIKNNVDTPCEKNEYCKYDEYSTPYYDLKTFGGI